MLQQLTRVLIGAVGAAAVTAALVSAPAAQADTENEGLLKAGATALGAVPDSTVVSLETERDSQWEVQLVTADGTEHQVELSHDGATITDGPTAKSEIAEEKAKHRGRVEAAKVDYRQAVTKVTQAVPGRIRELNLDTKNDTTVWEAEVHDTKITRHEVVIDAGSGDVVSKN